MKHTVNDSAEKQNSGHDFSRSEQQCDVNKTVDEAVQTANLDAQGTGTAPKMQDAEPKDTYAYTGDVFLSSSNFKRKIYTPDQLNQMRKGQIVQLYLEGQSQYTRLYTEYSNLSERCRRDSYLTFSTKSERDKQESKGDENKKTNDNKGNDDNKDGEGKKDTEVKKWKPHRKSNPKRGKGCADRQDDKLPVATEEVELSDEEIKELFGNDNYSELTPRIVKEYLAVPGRLVLREKHIHIYKNTKTGKIRAAATAKQVKFLSGSKLTSSLFGYLAESYYSDAIPVTRLVDRLSHNKDVLTPQEVYSWLRRFDEQVISIIAARMLQLALKCKANQMDETFFRCIEDMLESNRKFCYFWVLRTSKLQKDSPQIVTATFVKRRNAEELGKLLGDYTGDIMCDGHCSYPAYVNRKAKECIVRIVIAACLQHVRSRFYNVIKAIPGFNKMSLEEKMKIPAYQIVQDMKEIFKEEGKLKNVTREERAEGRVKILKMVNDMYGKIKDLSKSPNLIKGSLLYIAVHYALNRYDSVISGVNNPDMPLHNSDTERVFATDISIFRNNSKAFFSTDGGEQAGHYFTVSCTCKENGVAPGTYFRFLVEVIPDVLEKNQEKLDSGDLSFLDEYMPWGNTFKEYAIQADLEATAIYANLNWKAS
jgi:hypothetical protein